MTGSAWPTLGSSAPSQILNAPTYENGIHAERRNSMGYLFRKRFRAIALMNGILNSSYLYLLGTWSLYLARLQLRLLLDKIMKSALRTARVAYNLELVSLSMSYNQQGQLRTANRHVFALTGFSARSSDYPLIRKAGRFPACFFVWCCICTLTKCGRFHKAKTSCP